MSFVCTNIMDKYPTIQIKLDKNPINLCNTVSKKIHPLVEELYKTLKRLDLGVPEFEQETGIPSDRVYKWKKQATVPKTNDYLVLEDWLSKKKLDIVPRETGYISTRRALKNSTNGDVPVYMGNTRAGTIEVYSDDPSVNEPVASLPSTLFPGCNHAEKVNGSSMYPLISNQGFVIGKTIDKKGIINGEIYIVHTKWGMSMVKYLHKAEQKDHVKLVSYSKQVPPQEIPYDDITFVCRVYFIVNPS